MRILKKVIKTIFNILIILMVLLVILIAFNFIQMNIFGKQYSDFFGYTFFEVTTGSMSGTIEINDVIVVKITKDVSKNDIITFIENNSIVTHRIINEDGEKLITKGDANTGQDKPVERTNVIGKVEKVLPKFGIWVKVLTDIKVIICIVITFVLFGLAITSEKEEKTKREKSFSRFMRNRREKKNESSKEKKKS